MESTPPGDAPPPPPQRATPARKGARCGAGAGSPRPHRPHPGHTGRRTLAARSRGRAAGRGTVPDTRRPSQWWKAPPPGTPFRHTHSKQRRPARAHAVGPVLGLHARIHRTRDTRDAEPWLPAPEDRRPGEGQRLTPGAPHNGGKHPPSGTPYRHSHSEQRRPARAHAVGPLLGPHARTDRTRDTRVAEPWLPAPEDGRLREGQRLTPGAPHSGGKHPPRGRPSATPTASNAGPQGRTLWDRCWVPTPAPTAPGTHGTRNPGCPLQRTGGRGRDSAWHQAPRTMVEGTPPGDALLPFPQRATLTRKGARCGAGAGSPRPHRPHPGHTGRRTLTARPRGRAAGGGTAPDTRRPSQWWKAPPPGTPFRHPHSEQRRPARAHAVGSLLGPHARTDRTRDTRDAEPWLPAPGDRRPGEGQRLTPGAPHNGGKHPPSGTPYRHSHSEQRRPARAHAVGPVLGPHARTDRTRDTRDAEPWLPAPEDGRPGEG